jgi:hypothetical protein
MAQAPTPRLPLRISEILPATAPRAARGRAACRRGRGLGVHSCCNGQSCAPLASKINPLTPPPPFPIQQHVPT